MFESDSAKIWIPHAAWLTYDSWTPNYSFRTSHLALDGFAPAMATERIPRLAKMMKIYVRDIFTSSQKCCLSSYAFALVCLRKINRETELQGIQSGESIFTPATLKPKNTNPSSRLVPSETFLHRNLIKSRESFVSYGWGLWWWRAETIIKLLCDARKGITDYFDSQPSFLAVKWIL